MEDKEITGEGVLIRNEAIETIEHHRIPVTRQNPIEHPFERLFLTQPRGMRMHDVSIHLASVFVLPCFPVLYV